MAVFTCVACGKTLPPYQRYDERYDWCVECCELELLDQSLEDSSSVSPEIFSV